MEEEVGSSGKVNLSENVEAGAVKEGSRFLPSRRMRVWVRVLERRSKANQLLFTAVVAGGEVTGARGSGSVGCLTSRSGLDLLRS